MSPAAGARDASCFVDRDFVVRQLEELVRIPAVNPDLVPGALGETQIARYLAQVCESLGMRAKIEMAAPARPNVIAVLPVAEPGRGRSLMINGHTDTVGDAGIDRTTLRCPRPR